MIMSGMIGSRQGWLEAPGRKCYFFDEDSPGLSWPDAIQSAKIKEPIAFLAEPKTKPLMDS